MPIWGDPRQQYSIGGESQFPQNRSPGQPRIFSSALETNADDYDRIMKGYQTSVKEFEPTKFSPLSYSPIEAKQSIYNPGALSGATDVAKNFTSTGGFTNDEIGNIRARSISPIRSIYSNAMRNVRRQRSLQGGYSPNYSAVMSKMSRDLSSQLSDKTTDVEGSIAELVSRNKLSALPSYLSAASEDTRMRNANDQSNTAMYNRIIELNNANQMETDRYNTSMGANINQANQQGYGDMYDRVFRGNQAQQSLYGDTPGMANLFGQQELERERMRIQAEQEAARLALEKSRIAASMSPRFA